MRSALELHALFQMIFLHQFVAFTLIRILITRPPPEFKLPVREVFLQEMKGPYKDVLAFITLAESSNMEDLMVAQGTYKA